MSRTDPIPRIAPALLMVTLAACGRAGPAADDGAHTTPPTEVWLKAACDIDRQLDQQVQRLAEAGVVEVQGGQPLRWSFVCTGTTLQMEVEALGPPTGGTPVLWLGAAADPARVVPVYLEAGRGADTLAEAIRECEGAVGTTALVNLDLATEVAWQPGDGA